MFNTTDSSVTIPAFISKLWEMVNDKKYDYLIQWCPGGTSFVIKDQNKFCSELLPIYYKHNNMASFIRQLNKYGFRKIVPMDSASLKNDRSDLEFAHQHFVRDFPSLLIEIRRKTSNNNKEISYSTVVAQLAQHVQQLQQKHNNLESKLVSLKNENNALWREHSLLRHKHQKLQKIVNKLIQFLVTLVQQTRLNIKRRPAPLMIKDSSQFPIQSYSTVKNKSNPIPFINEINELNSPSSSSNAEIIVPDILDEEAARSILTDIAEYNSLQNAGVVQRGNCSEGSTLLAVPIQEVSPAIVYGKQSSKIKELQPDHKPSNEESSLLTNIKTKKLKRKTPGSSVPMLQNKSKKLFPKPHKSSASNNLVSVASNVLDQSGRNSSPSVQILSPQNNYETNSTSPHKNGSKPSSSIQIIAPNGNNSIPSIQILSPESFNTSNQITIQDEQMDMPEIVVLDPDNISNSELLKGHTQFIIKEANSNQQHLNVYDLKNDNNESISEVTSLPIILSPSGTEMSPATVSEEKSESMALSEPNVSPLQKDIDTIESDLDALKEILQGENFSFDASTLLSLFNNEDPLSLNMPEAGISNASGSSTPGNELISYSSPNLVDIIESFEDNESSEYSDPLSVASQTLNTPKPDESFDYNGPLNKRRKK